MYYFFPRILFYFKKVTVKWGKQLRSRLKGDVDFSTSHQLLPIFYSEVLSCLAQLFCMSLLFKAWIWSEGCPTHQFTASKNGMISWIPGSKLCCAGNSASGRVKGKMGCGYSSISYICSPVKDSGKRSSLWVNLLRITLLVKYFAKNCERETIIVKKDEMLQREEHVHLESLMGRWWREAWS